MSSLPHLGQLQIADAKLNANLLNPNHPEGGPKAKFLMRFGFQQHEPGTLRAAVASHAATATVLSTRVCSYGTLYELAGPLPSPDGRDPVVHVVWMIDAGSTVPRLITLVQGKERP